MGSQNFRKDAWTTHSDLDDIRFEPADSMK